MSIYISFKENSLNRMRNKNYIIMLLRYLTASVLILVCPMSLFSKEDSSFRLRSLISSGEDISATRNAVIWNGWGLGISTWSYEKTIDGNKFELSNMTHDFSYTFGKEWSLTIGIGFNLEGEGTINNTANEYKTTIVSGNYNFAVLGTEFGIFEILFGYRKDDFEYAEFSDGSTTLDINYEISGGIILGGLGLSF